jgi:hypothetical protein
MNADNDPADTAERALCNGVLSRPDRRCQRDANVAAVSRPDLRADHCGIGSDDPQKALAAHRINAARVKPREDQTVRGARRTLEVHRCRPCRGEEVGHRREERPQARRDCVQGCLGGQATANPQREIRRFAP